MTIAGRRPGPSPDASDQPGPGRSPASGRCHLRASGHRALPATGRSRDPPAGPLADRRHRGVPLRPGGGALAHRRGNGRDGRVHRHLRGGRRHRHGGAARVHRVAADGGDRRDRRGPRGSGLDSARHYATLYRQASERLVTAHEEERATSPASSTTASARRSPPSSSRSMRPRSTVRTAGIHERIAAGPGSTRARELASSALAETRQVAAKLRPTRVHEMGLGAALPNLAGRPACPSSCASIRRSAPRPARTRARDRRLPDRPGGGRQRGSSRQARRIWISVHVVDETVRLVVGDDGIGFDRGGA